MIYAMFSSAGEIVRVYTGPSPELNTPDGCEYMEVDSIVDDSRFCVVDGEVTERPVMPISHSELSFNVEEYLTITDIPEGTEVRTPGEALIVDDGVLEWSTAVPGTFSISLHKFPYQDVRLQIEVSL